MNLLQLKQISVSFGGAPLLNGANLVITANERIGLVGRNGAGKSTLLKIIRGTLEAESGEYLPQQGLKVGKLIQEVPHNIRSDIRSVIAMGHPTFGKALSNFYSDETNGNFLQEITGLEAWDADQQVKKLCSRFNLEPEQDFSSLSGGMKRRVLLAQALVTEPELLLLDEPTNHLDIDTIIWLENLLLNTSVALIIVSHDRSFINKLSTRIIEIDRGKITSWPGNFNAYLSGKAKALEDEEKHNAEFDKRLAKEETWIRQGIKARRTRNEGRVRALKKMRNERQARREQQGKASFSMNQADKSGKLVVEAIDIHFSFEDHTIIDKFSTTIMRGDKVGIVGPNGCGKSTLIKILTEQLKPSSGEVRFGTRLETAYLDQHRSEINDDMNVLDNISGGLSEITINGKSKHIMSYVQDFLFSPERARSPARILSGGERNRLMLAKLFTKPFNLLILDEPTNDLDYETLELLEQLLVDYNGTLLLVSHDREFLNNVVSSTIAFEGNGQVHEYIGGYDDWQHQRRQQADNQKKEIADAQNATTSTTNNKAEKTAKKLSYNQQRELNQLPQKVEQLEASLEQLQQKMGDPDFYKQDTDKITEAGNQLKQLETKLAEAYKRWEELEDS